MSLQIVSFCIVTLLVVFTSGVRDAVSRSCPNGWRSYNGNCYLLNRVKKSWLDARKHCVSLGSHLVRIESANENMFLKKAFTGKSNYFWTDGTDIHKDGEWIWSSTYEPVSYTNFAKGQPDSGTRQSYLGLFTTALWDDGTGSYKAMSICEIDAEVKSNCPCSKFLLEELVKCKKRQ